MQPSGTSPAGYEKLLQPEDISIAQLSQHANIGNLYNVPDHFTV
jgi:hypothetical protein